MQLNYVAAFPAGRFLETEVLAWVRLFRVLVFADIGIGILNLIEVAQSVIDLAMLALVGTNWNTISDCPNKHGDLHTVQKQVSHRTVAFRHLPIIDGDLRCL